MPVVVSTLTRDLYLKKTQVVTESDEIDNNVPADSEIGFKKCDCVDKNFHEHLNLLAKCNELHKKDDVMQSILQLGWTFNETTEGKTKQQYCESVRTILDGKGVPFVICDYCRRIL